jgi:hypothetical protein
MKTIAENQEMPRQLATRPSAALSTLSIDELVAQADLIENAVNRVMRPGEHYGIIPGTGNKPTLLKPGAEKLLVLFGLAPSYTVEVERLQGEHRNYIAKCELRHRASGTFVGDATGSCTTLESKYRYRSEAVRDEDGQVKTVPKEYWNKRDSSLLGGPQFSTKKVDGQWVIAHRVEYDCPSDYYNTCSKMAQKRALVAAILNATAASDTFTQDIEDMPHHHESSEGTRTDLPKPPPATKRRKKQEERQEQRQEVRGTLTGYSENGGYFSGFIGELRVYTKDEQLGRAISVIDGSEAVAECGPTALGKTGRPQAQLISLVPASMEEALSFPEDTGYEAGVEG